MYTPGKRTWAKYIKAPVGKAVVVAPRPGPIKALAKKVKKLSTVVRSVETKYCALVNTQNVGAGVTGNLSLLQISEGDGPTNRTGRQISVQSIQIKPRFVTITESNVTYRMIVVQWLQQVPGTSPLLSDYLDDSTKVNSLTKWGSSKAFRVLLDRTVTLNVSFLNQDQVASPNYFINLRKKPIKVLYNGGGVNDLQKNGIYCWTMARIGDATSANQPTAVATDTYINYPVRVTFTDA